MLKPLFSSSDLLSAARSDAYTDCVLRKIRPIDPRLLIASSSRRRYYAQWLWDTMFVLDLLSILPGRRRRFVESFRIIGTSRTLEQSETGLYARMIANFMAPYERPRFAPAWSGRRFQRIRRPHCLHGVWNASMPQSRYATASHRTAASGRLP